MRIWTCVKECVEASECGLWIRPKGQPEWLSLDVRQHESVLISNEVKAQCVRTPKKSRLGGDSVCCGEIAAVVRQLPQTPEIALEMAHMTGTALDAAEHVADIKKMRLDWKRYIIASGQEWLSGTNSTPPELFPVSGQFYT